MMNKKSSNIDIESLLGIDPTWSKKRIEEHLGKEFAKWNGRLNTLNTYYEKTTNSSALNKSLNKSRRSLFYKQ